MKFQVVKSMENESPDCQYPGCFFCVMKEGNPSKRRASIVTFFKELSLKNNDGQVLPVSGLWNTAMAHPNDPEFIELGVFECTTALIWKGLRNQRWLSHDQNIYIPYYAAHIIGSYTMNVEEFAERAVQAGVISPLVELLKGRLTWVEQRVAVRALGHLATYDSTFSSVAAHGDILEVAIQLAMSSLEIVYSDFYHFVDKRLSYHCDLLTRGMGGSEMESRKAEEWASQLQCWSLQLINCFALKSEYLPAICKPEFLEKLPAMWGGLVNENSPAGIGLIRTICHHRAGRGPVASCPGVVQSLCNTARSSDDWQHMAIDCLLWFIQDSTTCHKVMQKAIPTLMDLSEVSSKGGRHRRIGDCIVNIITESVRRNEEGWRNWVRKNKEVRGEIEEVMMVREKIEYEKSISREDIQIKQAASLVVKLEGNSLFSSGDVSGAALKYSEALHLCPVRWSRKERVVLYSNRAQCYLLLQKPMAAVSDATRALCIHKPINRHAKSLWRRAQAYHMLMLPKESLLDAILFLNECRIQPISYRIPSYAHRFVRQQMRAAWIFSEPAMKTRGCDSENGDGDGDSEWETASESEGGIQNCAREYRV